MAKISEVVSGSIFLTQEKALKRILQDRERGDLSKARQHALEALEKWPNDYGLAMEAIQASLDISDYPQAANLLKNAHRRHGSRRDEIVEYARSAFFHSKSTHVGAFLVDVHLKSRDLEAIADLVNAAPEAFLGELLKRCETRARNLANEGQERSALFGENAALLGILYRESKQYEKSAAMLCAALETLPGDERPIGEALVRLDGEMPGNAAIKFSLGLASLHLGHPDKAEARFFQCMERPAPPVDRILEAVADVLASLPNGTLLAGEALIRAGRVEEGAAALREYIDGDPPAAGGDAPPARDERCRRTVSRLTVLPADVFSLGGVAFAYAEAAAALGLMKDAAGALEESLERDPARADAVVAWLERMESAAPTAPGEALLARLYAAGGRVDDAVRAARIAADADPSAVPGLVASISALGAPPREGDPKLLMLLAELRARLGDRESAEEALGTLRRTGGIPEEELSRLAGEIMSRCGVTLPGVAAVIDMALRRGSIEEALPHVVTFCRENREEHESLAAELRELAADDERRWRLVAGMLDAMADEEDLSQPLRMVRAMGHLFCGEIERAIFEFDQLMMFDGGLRRNLIDIYRGAIRRSDGNATLHLALYHLYLDEESFAEAARHLCRTLELDPGQIRDIMQRFDRLVEREPGNPAIWETMLATALSMRRTSLAKEILKRAIATLPPGSSATLHIHGARIAAAEGAFGEALNCLAAALDAEQPDARGIEKELNAVVERDPREPQAHFLLGRSLALLARERDAVGSFRRCLELSPDYRGPVRQTLERLLPLGVEPWHFAGLLGEIVWLEGNRGEALRLFASAERGPVESLAEISASLDRVRAEAPDDADLALLHARILAREGRHEKSTALLAAILERDPGLGPVVNDILQSIVAVSPAAIEANLLLARMYLDAGDPARSREALARLMADETSDAARLAAAVEPFLRDHGEDGGFLLHYGALLARAGADGQALARLRASFERDSSRAGAVVAVLNRHRWPDGLAAAKSLLAADCLIASERLEEAFSVLGAFADPDVLLVNEIVSRLTALIGIAPRREHFSFGAALLAAADRLDDARRFIEYGAGVLGGADALDLTMELAEILHAAGHTEHASRIFGEALAASPDRSPVYARIERSYIAWGDRMIATLAARVAGAPAFAGAIELLVELLIERGRGAEALDAIARSAAPKTVRTSLLGRVYLAMDRPILACAALAGAAGDESLSADARRQTLYFEGIARERAGDSGRAAAIFAAIAAQDGAGDSRERAMRNYAAFIAESCGEPAYTIEKTESI
jgi:tetratricopeptide (TPR) repeat protein